MLGARSSAQAPQAPAQETLTKEGGARVMRMILTMQANTPYGPKTSYGTLKEILPLLPDVQRDATVIDEHTASYRGYTIRMTRTADRQRFEISIVPNSGACAISWFSNEKNVIYVGQALGCPAQ
jgi:hypothetical protein